MDARDRIRLFGLSPAAIERDLDKVEKAFKIDLQRSLPEDRDEGYYPQFAQALRQEAAAMGKHYEMFYCLEKTIRKLVAETLAAQHGENWWDTTVPQTIRDNVRDNMQRELDSGVTLRSEEEIDFTTFGELGEIVRSKWDDFDTIFSSQKAFTKIMTNLNTLRGPIAHCCPLSEDEVIRLGLTVKDWFRLME
jgi:Swt1-like HEPN